ncbi:Nuclease-related domain-containing protein [Desulfonauticus submarinus]|uniref:Nuclease-related domain-containing protein n=1 Tax=Desulfonauticus submarinus TaxID=206665 RepID=A0A1H0AJH1_9BACT|nr:nuclease-related domain-containing protein [Desulfonauticus submarinus]SDN33511.1 Nuclease-related domain-containing protein [Desulfonauticus submarinus]
MLIKSRDSKEKDLKLLRQLLKYNLTEEQRSSIKKQILILEKGLKTEDEAAYYINFYYENSKNWIVIHDLRLELKGKVAQIDHILINRFFDIYVLESKFYKYGIKITDNGEFEVFYKNKSIGIPSPIEQNKRHIKLLADFIDSYDLLPRRAGVKIKPRFFSYILISPNSTIKRPPKKLFDTSTIIKADTLEAIIDKQIDKQSTIECLGLALKTHTLSDIEKFAKKLVSFHSPININWFKKFNIKLTKNTDNPKNKKYFCARCKCDISEKEAFFCWNNKEIFKGKAYCLACQRYYKKH